MERRRDYFILATLFGAGTVGLIATQSYTDFTIGMMLIGGMSTVLFSAIYFQINDYINQILNDTNNGN